MMKRCKEAQKTQTFRQYSVLLLLCGALAMAACAKSPTNNTQATTTETNETPPIASVQVVAVTPQEVTLTRGASGDALVSVKVTNGYHVNANPPTFPYLKPTELEIQPAEGVAVEFITYPNPISKKFPFAEKPLAVYEGEATLKARLNANKSAQPGKHNLSAKLRVQACDDKVCYAPGALDLTIPVNIK